MNAKLASRILLSLVLAALLAGCGHVVPQADEQVLQSKKSLLVLASASLPADAADKLKSMLTKTRNAEQIAYVWKGGIAAIDDAMVAGIKQSPYDRIVVIGSGLIASAIEAAKKTAEHRWVLLADSVKADGIPAEPPANTAIVKVDETAVASMWNSWALEQTGAGRVIEWVSDTAHPVPSAWAPSEEADHIVMLDIYGPSLWYNQLAVQASAHRPDWIALLVPLSEGDRQKLNALHVPVADMANGVALDFQWETILSKQWQAVKGGEQPKGVTLYSADELTVRRK